MPNMPIVTTEELAPGAEVEVRTHYQENWARGFEIASVDGDRVLVRRRSDGSLLPTALDRADVRRRPSPNESPWMRELHDMASMRLR
jgi:hypothetical protein